MNSLRNGQVNMTKKNEETTNAMGHVSEEINKMRRVGVSPEAIKAMEALKAKEIIDTAQEDTTPVPESKETQKDITSSDEIENTTDDNFPSPVNELKEQKKKKSPPLQQIPTNNKDKIEEDIEDNIKVEIESRPSPQNIKLKVEQENPMITTFTPLPSKYSIEENIDNQTFSSRPPLNTQKGKNFTYRLKSPEVEPFNDIMLLKRTTSPSEALRGIFELVLRRYETAIREEAAWNIEFRNVDNDPEIEDITSVFDMGDENFRKQRLIRMGFFTAPQRTRGDGIGKAIGCTIGQDLVELIELLMVALDINKPAPAYQWIMNVFVKDYAEILSKKTKKIKQAKALFSGKNVDTYLSS